MSRHEGDENMAEIEPGLRRDFVLAGNAVVTLQGKGTRYTYRVLRNAKPGSKASHWVHVLNGPNNETDFRFVGGITEQGFYVSDKAPVREDAPSAQAFAWFWKHPEDTRVTVLHAGRCGRCGRLLTTPESIRTGLGPTCAGRAS